MKTEDIITAGAIGALLGISIWMANDRKLLDKVSKILRGEGLNDCENCHLAIEFPNLKNIELQKRKVNL